MAITISENLNYRESTSDSWSPIIIGSLIDSALFDSKADKTAFRSFTITLASNAWINQSQTIYDGKFLATGYAYVISPASVNFTNYAEAQIYADDVSTDGQITFHCIDVPSSNLTVNIIRVVSA